MVTTTVAEAVEGLGLHSGERCWVRLVKRLGPVSFRHNDTEWPVGELRVLRSDCGVRVGSNDGRLEIDLVEHLLAALGGLGIQDGVAVEVQGPELPILDAASGVWARMLGALGLTRKPPRQRVVRQGSVETDGSRYEFSPADSMTITVEVDYTARGLGVQQAHWSGGEAAFLDEVATARSFGFLADHGNLRQSGRAAGAAGSAVIVFGEAGQRVDAGPPARTNELACHKLLDLVGDFYLCGGPPLGQVRATRPGHSRNIWAARQALTLGIVSPIGG